MAKRKRSRSGTRTRSRQRKQEYPGWVWMIFGLAIGLSVAFAIYMKDRQTSMPVPVATQQPASLSNALDDNEEARDVAPEAPQERRFDFYDMLPNFEVIIPEQEADVKRDQEIEAVVKPGVYVLQAGSFKEYADADRRRAQLALQGIESRIQRVTIDDKTYHRVRIGPLDDLDELNLLRARLRQASIDALRIRLGD